MRYAVEPSYPALIVAACEVVDAMTHDRGYREALPVEMALVEIGFGAGGNRPREAGFVFKAQKQEKIVEKEV